MSNRERVRVELSKAGFDNHVWIGDVDIRNVVTAVRIERKSDGTLTASLDIVPDECRVWDAELRHVVQSHLRPTVDKEVSSDEQP